MSTREPTGAETLLLWGFSPLDFLVDDIHPNERTLFATHLGIEAKAELSFLVDSKHPDHEPHVVTHDTVQPTSCDCEYYTYRVQWYLENGQVPPKVCAHFLRASLVLLKRRLREKEEQRINAPLNSSGKTFNLLK